MRSSSRIGLGAVFCCLASSCHRQEYTWAFAQDLDGTIKENEFCRESLADAIYNPRANVTRQGASNVFLVTGSVESYRIYGWGSQAECETALTGLISRSRL